MFSKEIQTLVSNALAFILGYMRCEHLLPHSYKLQPPFSIYTCKVKLIILPVAFAPTNCVEFGKNCTVVAAEGMALKSSDINFINHVELINFRSHNKVRET